MSQNQTLRQRIETLEQDIQNLQNDNDDLERKLTKKQGTIEYLKTLKQAPVSLSISTNNTTKNRIRLEDPNKFFRKKDDKVEFDI